MIREKYIEQEIKYVLTEAEAQTIQADSDLLLSIGRNCKPSPMGPGAESLIFPRVTMEGLYPMESLTG